MAKAKFSTGNYLVRLLIAVALVFATFNPIQPYSYFYWAVNPLLSDMGSFSILKGLAGIVLLIGWTIYLRATSRALGVFGILLAVAFFGLLLWLIVEQGWVGIENRETITWLVLIGLSGVLSIGLSWSHIRRRMTGQLDVDETDD
jgi:hypothetical protein